MFELELYSDMNFLCSTIIFLPLAFSAIWSIRKIRSLRSLTEDSLLFGASNLNNEKYLSLVNIYHISLVH